MYWNEFYEEIKIIEGERVWSLKLRLSYQNYTNFTFQSHHSILIIKRDIA